MIGRKSWCRKVFVSRHAKTFRVLYLIYSRPILLSLNVTIWATAFYLSAPCKISKFRTKFVCNESFTSGLNKVHSPWSGNVLSPHSRQCTSLRTWSVNIFCSDIWFLFLLNLDTYHNGYLLRKTWWICKGQSKTHVSYYI